MNTDDPIEEPIEKLIERSSLGSAGARQLRSRTTAAELRKIKALRKVAEIRDQSGDRAGALRIARNLAEGGNPDGLVVLADAWQEYFPRDAGELYLEAARIDEKSGNLASAERNYEKAVECDGGSTIRSSLADFLLRHGNIQKARQILDALPAVAYPELTRYASSYRLLTQTERFERRRWLPLRELSEVSDLADVMVRLGSIGRLLRVHRNSLAHAGDDHDVPLDPPLPSPQQESPGIPLWRRTDSLASDIMQSPYFAIAALLGAARQLADNARQFATSKETDPSPLASSILIADGLIESTSSAINSALITARDSIFTKARDSVSYDTYDAWAGPRQLQTALTADSIGAARFARMEEVHRGDPDVFYQSLAESCVKILAAAREMVGADLSEIELAGLPLAGVQWSTLTRWPERWHQVVLEQSVELRPGLFEINPDGRLRAVNVS